MAHRIAYSTLNASTVDVMNVIRQNASMQYQQSVPLVGTAADIPKVGEVIYGTPAFANEFINALVNRIAFVAINSATFNNPYVSLKKGVLDYGETVEEIFVNIAKVYEFSQDKAAGREFKQYKPDVRTAFHAMNWRVLYPITISDEELRMAFLSANGVTDLIARIVDSIYTAASYDEFLLFKYLLIKAVNHSQMYVTGTTVSGAGDAVPKALAKVFRGLSNKLPFMSSLYNAAKVKTTTPKDRQVIFMDAQFNADFDVEVLATWIRPTLWADCTLLMIGLPLTMTGLRKFAPSVTVLRKLLPLNLPLWAMLRLLSLTVNGSRFTTISIA